MADKENDYSEYWKITAGTCAYVSSESLWGKYYIKKSDFCALGDLLYEMITT